MVLSTDAQGVMHTSLEAQYQFAHQIVEAFKRGTMRVPVLIGGEQVEVSWRNIEDAMKGKPSPVPRELAEQLQARFSDPVGDMQHNARDYEQRIDSIDRGAPPPPPPPGDSSQSAGGPPPLHSETGLQTPIGPMTIGHADAH